jgi:hypothetical protein
MSYPTIQTPPVSSNPNCAECIVTLPVQPTTSLILSAEVREGNNAVLKQVASKTANYPAQNIYEVGVNLAPGASYTIGATSVTCIFTSSPLQVTFSLNGNLTTFNVNNLLILDDSHDSVTITNSAATGGPTASVSISYAYVSTT